MTLLSALLVIDIVAGIVGVEVGEVGVDVGLGEAEAVGEGDGMDELLGEVVVVGRVGVGVEDGV